MAFAKARPCQETRSAQTNLKMTLSEYRRQLKDAGVKGSHLKRELRAFLIRKDRGRCVRCGSKCQLTVDHIIPRYFGGRGTEENSQTLCFTCNFEKSILPIDYRTKTFVVIPELFRMDRLTRRRYLYNPHKFTSTTSSKTI